MTYYEIMKKIMDYPGKLQRPKPRAPLKKIMLAATLGIMVGVLVSAQQQTNITTTVCPGVGCVDVTTSGQGTLAITISGTWVGTITFSGTVDGTNYTSLGMALITTPGTIVTTTTGNGTWSGSVAGLQKVRIAFTAFTSGTAAISARTQQSANHIGGGSGGGGGSGTVTSIATTAPITGGTITTTGTIGCATCIVTGGDINSSNQVTVTHLAAALPVAQGGTGVAASTGTVAVVLSTSPTLVTPVLGTPTSVTLTNATGLPEAGLSLTDITTANASASAHGFLPKFPNNTTTWLRGDGTYTAVTAGTNANLTGVITSVGNATSIGAQTGTGTTFVTQTSPTLITPVLGVASGTSLANTSFISSTQSINATSTDGLLLTNTTAAANGAQQWSPRIHLTAQGWKTTATAASQQVEWLVENIPIQNATVASTILRFTPVINTTNAVVPFYLCASTTGNVSASGPGQGIGLDGVNTGCNGQIAGWAGLGPVNTGNQFGVWNNGSVRETFVTNGFILASGQIQAWSSAAAGTFMTQTVGDIGLCRGTVAQLNVNDGTTTCTNARDLLVRHYLGGGVAPAVTNTSANSCGTTAATIVGTDTAGKVTVGATSGTSCTVTFVTAYTNPPACAGIDESTAVLTTAKSTTTTVILSGIFTAADVVAYHCLSY